MDKHPTRIKSLEELNEDMSKYKGMILNFREDGVIPEPMKSVDEIQQLHEKAPIYYGRSGEKYGEQVPLTEEARQDQTVKIDHHAAVDYEPNFTFPDESVMDAKQSVDETIYGREPEEQTAYSANGLNVEYLSSLLEKEEKMPEAEPEKKLRLEEESMQSEPQLQVKEAVATKAVSLKKPLEPSEKKSNTQEAVIRTEKEVWTATKVLHEVIVYGICFLVAIVLSLLLVTFVGQKSEVIGDSMNNTLQNGQQLVVDKLTYDFRKPKRFDIVVFPHKDSKYIKRVIGLPGETVSIEEGYIYINGQLLAEDTYGNAAIKKENYYRLEQPVKLGNDEYFVLGDNRNNSSDSRDPEVGNIKKKEIIGRAVFRIWPLKEMGSLR